MAQGMLPRPASGQAGSPPRSAGRPPSAKGVAVGADVAESRGRLTRMLTGIAKEVRAAWRDSCGD
eukprot:360592-Chlamydomonas_euryale.AAC.5